MQAAGCTALFDIERLNVMGLGEAIPRLVSLLPARRRLAARLSAWRPQVMVGVDAPDFTLGLEQLMRGSGVPTVHYVSPSAWAWRRYRVRRIRRDVNLLLTLLPFESAFFNEHGINARFVGHPLADELAELASQHDSRSRLGLPLDAPVVALLPGSRPGEVSHIAPAMLGAARWLQARRKGLRFVVPAINAAARDSVRRLAADVDGLDTAAVHVVDGQSRSAMRAADLVLVASGTASLEAMLLQRPMVVTYRVSAQTWWLGQRLLKVPHVSLPNLLAGRELVPEVLQEAATPVRLGSEVLALLDAPADERRALLDEFASLSATLRGNAAARAAEAVLAVAGGDSLP